MKRRLLAGLLSVALLISVVNCPVAASVEITEKRRQPAVENILDEYHSDLVLTTSKNQNSNNDLSRENDLKKQKVIQDLRQAGYEAYELKAETYATLEDTLKTDFDDINLDVNSSYIIAVSGEENAEAMRDSNDVGTPGSSFTYTYNGREYTMRYLTITAADVSGYGKASSVNILQSKSATVIQNCLDAAVSAYFDALTPIPFGTIASILGLTIVDFSTAATSTLSLYAGTNWTRVYTQVWSPNYEMWMFASCVEKAKCSSYVTGQYYAASTNSYQQIHTNQVSETKYSNEYYNYTWRKRTAAQAYQASLTTYDFVGDVDYKYNGNTVIEHKITTFP